MRGWKCESTRIRWYQKLGSVRSPEVWKEEMEEMGGDDVRSES